MGQDLGTALNGQPDSLWRLSPDNKAIILSAAYPIFIDGNVMGAVIVEQTTNGIRTLRNRALEQLFHVILAVMLLGTLGLLLLLAVFQVVSVHCATIPKPLSMTMAR